MRSPPARQRPKAFALIQILALAAIYFVFARLGLSLATIGRSVTLVWPATGISLVALLLFGRRLWPGVTLGALLVNALTPGVPFLSACGMAIGNTLEAVFGTYFLRRAGFKDSLERVRDVVLLLVLAAGLSTTVSATFGALSLRLGGVIPRASSAWWEWWLGDLMGDLIVVPLLLTAIHRARWRRAPRRLKEALSLVAALLIVGLVGFGLLPLPISRFAHPYIVFPVLILAALRFQLAGAAGANLIISCTAIWATVNERGAFLAGTLNERLLQVQTFMAIAALTSLILGAAAAERLRAIRVRDQFLSMASHELKTPLTPMKLQIHLLWRTLEREGGRLAEQVRKPFSVFEKQLDRIAKLVDALLDVSRVDSGHLELKAEELDLGVLVRETVDAFGEELALANCSIEMHIEENVRGFWDRLRIQQVVSNLLTNAMKYAGGAPITILVNADSPRARARISVRDRGIGIPKEQQQIIFEAFERGSYAPRVGGLGLGLYIVSKIVEAHQGSIRVRSDVGSGSTFTVELPRKQQRTIRI